MLTSIISTYPMVVRTMYQYCFSTNVCHMTAMPSLQSVKSRAPCIPLPSLVSSPRPSGQGILLQFKLNSNETISTGRNAYTV